MNPAPRLQTSPDADLLSPAQRYQELFVAVQRERVFDDSKTFPDAAPRSDPEAILAAYRRESRVPGFDLRAFVHAHFILEEHVARGASSRAGRPLIEHIDALWSVLERHPAQHPRGSSLLPLPHDYVVPGGRFVEMYYWDSYFTMLGLAESGRGALVRAMTDNFASLIDRYGRVPNGTRTYYLSRSQPPMFALMVELVEEVEGSAGIRYLPQLRREHAFWMQGEAALGPAQRRVVRLRDGSLLNRYWDDLESPREESWREDVATAQASGRPEAEVHRNLRAACESGWDFSSRWFAETDAGYGDLGTIRTTQLLPVDLNALLHRLETTIARLAHTSGDERAQADFTARAERRLAAIDRWLWDDERGAWFDYDWSIQKSRRGLNAATAAPLFVQIGDEARAARVAALLRERLLAPGGLSTTEVSTGQQWDRPNGWAPLHYIAVRGLENYGQQVLADEIRSRWLRTVAEYYCREGKLVEKYSMREQPEANARGGGGGEYPLQDGFGWTNGVTRRWLRDRPEHNRCVGA